MRSKVLFGVVGIAALLLGTGCSHTPESFCQSWVENTCNAIAGCCASGQSFDADQCQIDLSDSCLKATAVDQIQDGQYKFDYGSAETCFGTISSCADFATASTDTSYDHLEACTNMVTGYRPAGAACSSSDDCQRNGDFSECYDGSGTMNAGGVCVEVVNDNTTCSFSFSDYKLHVCADGLFCDKATVTVNPTDPPSMQDYEFSAACEPLVQAGGSCASTATNILACANGLFCNVSGTSATCTELLSLGAVCMGDGQCGPGLGCVPNGNGNGSTCQTAGGEACYTPVAMTMPTCDAKCATAITDNLPVCATDAAASADYTAFTQCAQTNCTCETDTSMWASDNTCLTCLGQMCTSEETACGTH